MDECGEVVRYLSRRFVCSKCSDRSVEWEVFVFSERRKVYVCGECRLLMMVGGR
jgi:hypothetical protein